MTTPRMIRFKLNGRSVSASVMPHDTIVEMLTNQFDMTGARESCGQGLCGCCTVHVDDKAVSGCLSLAAFLDGTAVTTIEGLANGDELDPVQQAFVDAGAFQCGFCTPGFIMTACAFLAEEPAPDAATIRDAMSGNLCRCTGYAGILAAAAGAAEELAGTGVDPRERHRPEGAA